MTLIILVLSGPRRAANRPGAPIRKRIKTDKLQLPLLRQKPADPGEHFYWKLSARLHRPLKSAREKKGDARLRKNRYPLEVCLRPGRKKDQPGPPFSVFESRKLGGREICHCLSRRAVPPACVRPANNTGTSSRAQIRRDANFPGERGSPPETCGPENRRQRTYASRPGAPRNRYFFPPHPRSFPRPLSRPPPLSFAFAAAAR